MVLISQRKKLPKKERKKGYHFVGGGGGGGGGETTIYKGINCSEISIFSEYISMIFRRGAK